MESQKDILSYHYLDYIGGSLDIRIKEESKGNLRKYGETRYHLYKTLAKFVGSEMTEQKGRFQFRIN